MLKTVKHNPPLAVDTDKCIGCKACMAIGCPASFPAGWQGGHRQNPVRGMRRVRGPVPEAGYCEQGGESMSEVKSVLIVGVGGQGTLLASRLLGNAMVAAGHDVKVSEVHGMSQRGGSVETYVRYGEKVYSPVIEKGGADYILAFEQLEAARYLPYLKKGGAIIVNTQRIDPMPVVAGNAVYPEGLIEKLQEKEAKIVAVDALSLAEQAGSSKAVNVVLIGVMAKHMELSKEEWLKTIEATVPQKFIEMNKKAFELGYER